MLSLIIGISSGLLVIVLIGIFRCLEKEIIYGLVLSGIGFLYVGFSWTNPWILSLNAVQAVFFLLLAYYGIKRSVYILAAGYLLHGTWDIFYSLLSPNSNLIPPHYDLFCLSIDFTIGVYLLVIKYRGTKIAPHSIEVIKKTFKAEPSAANRKNGNKCRENINGAFYVHADL